MRIRLPIKLALIALLTLGVVGSASARNIGVVLISPHKLSFLKIGVMVFGNQYASTDLVSPEIGDAIYSLIEEEIGMESQVNISRVRLEAESVRRIGKIAYDEANSLFGSSKLGIEDEIRKLASDCRCEELVVVSDVMRSEVHGSNQVARGVTLLRLAKDSATLLVPLRITRFDAKSLSVLGTGRILLEGSPFTFDWPDELPPTMALSTQSALSASASLLAARQSYRKWRVHGVREGLFKSGLRPSCAEANYFAYTPEADQNVASISYRAPPALSVGASAERCQ